MKVCKIQKLIVFDVAENEYFSILTDEQVTDLALLSSHRKQSVDDGVVNKYDAASSNRRFDFSLRLNHTLCCNQKAWGKLFPFASSPSETHETIPTLEN